MKNSIYKNQDLENYRVRIRVKATDFGAYYLDFKEIIRVNQVSSSHQPEYFGIPKVED